MRIIVNYFLNGVFVNDESGGASLNCQIKKMDTVFVNWCRISGYEIDLEAAEVW